MRIAVLTTDTAHHRYFMRRLAQELPEPATLVISLFETRPYPWARNARKHIREHWLNPVRAITLNPYLQPKSFSAHIDAFERPRFFPDGDDALPDTVPMHTVHSANDPDARDLLSAAEPDLLLIYGSGLVKPETYRIAKTAAINAHGGKIPGYRGLDTNLWAAYLGRPQDMTVTLHEVDANLDTGAVYSAQRLEPKPDLSLVSLRYHTAILCTEMFLALIRRFIDNPPQPSPQDGTPSPYFGPMPWLLKKKTDRILRKYAQTTGTATANA